MRDLDARRGHDTGDFCDLIWANAALPRVTGLGGPEGPEPGKPSPRCRAPSLSQEPKEASDGD